jgi:hypothetical protein
MTLWIGSLMFVAVVAHLVVWAIRNEAMHDDDEAL